MPTVNRLAIASGFAFVLFAGSGGAEPSPVVLTDATNDVALGPHLAILKDTTGAWSIDAVSSAPLHERFTDSDEESPHTGQYLRAAWSRFTLKNESQRRNWIFEMRPGINYGIEVYWRDDPAAEWTVQRAGEEIPFHLQEVRHRHFAVRVDLEPGVCREYIVRAAPDIFFVHQRLYSESEFDAHVRRESISLGVYYGLILGLAVYNLVLFIYLRDQAYLYYVLMVAAGAVYFLQFNGLAQEYLWPEAAFKWSRYVLISAPIYLALVLRFVQVFLLTREHSPGVHRVMSWLIGIAFVFPVSSLAGLQRELGPIWLTLYNWSLWLTIIIAATVSIRRGFVPARYFLIAWSGFVLGALIVLSVVFGGVPFGVLSWNAQQIGQALEILLLSLSLGNRISLLQRAKDAQDRELDTARRLQMELLPDAPPSVVGLDIAGRCIPAGHVGGDMYRYFEVPNGVAVGLADVTGHAMEAAIPAVMFTGLLESQMQTDKPLPQLFANLNDSLFHTLGQRRFVCFAMVRVTNNNRVLLTTCGCPYPLLLRTNGEIKELGCEFYPLGVRPHVSYRVIESSLQPGDVLVLYSDGITEAQSEEGDFFGDDRTRSAVFESHSSGMSADATCDYLLERVQQFVGGAEQGDDMTCVVLRALENTT